LRAEITDWIDSPGPWRGHVHWAGRNRLVTDGTTGPQLLDLDGTQLALVFHALKLAQEAAASSIRQSNYTILLDRLAFALPRTQRQLLTLTVLTETPGLDSAKSADLAPVLGPVLAATRNWRRLNLRYRAADGAVTLRTVWPIILHYNDACLIAWCELRGEQRSFRLDRMLSAEVLPDAPLRARADLLAEWEDVRWQD
jgi:predicted DNA-binding transcriptional regulator YafY